jgi:hypothetical protein
MFVPDEHVCSHLAVTAAACPFSGAPGPVPGGVQVAAVLEEPTDHLTGLGHDLEERSRPRRLRKPSVTG